MGLFSANFAAKMGAAGSLAPDIFAVLDVDFPTGAGGRIRFVEDIPAAAYAAAPQWSRLSAGAAGPVHSGTSARPGGVQLQTLRARVADTDKLVSKILCGRYECRRSPVAMRWGHPALVEADWCTHFTGILQDWSFANGSVELEAKTDDRVLSGAIPRRQILRGWAPTAPADVLGTYCPIVLGIHNANGLDARGQVPAFPISIDPATGYVYLVSLGAIRSVLRVYKNSVLQTAGVNYNVAQQWRGGLYMTVVVFTGATVATDVVTCDVEGLTVDNTTSGALILLPADQAKWVLNNLVFADWNGGAYSTTTAPIDAPLFARTASYQATFLAEGSHYLGGSLEQTSGMAFLTEWLGSNIMIRARWSPLGKFGVFPFDHRWAPYTTAFWAHDSKDEFDASFGTKHSAGQIVSRVSVEYLPGKVAGKMWQRLEVQDLTRWTLERVTDSFTLAASSARFL